MQVSGILKYHCGLPLFAPLDDLPSSSFELLLRQSDVLVQCPAVGLDLYVHIRGETIADWQGHQQYLLGRFPQWCLQGFDRKAGDGKVQSVGGLGGVRPRGEHGECE